MAGSHPILERLGRTVSVDVGEVALAADLTVPEEARAVVAFAHGSGSGRHSPRNRFVAEILAEAGLATLLMDLLTEDEERRDRETGELRFDIGLLARRLVASVDWLSREPSTQGLPVGCFGASTGAAAALHAAADRPDRVAAVVSRGGRPDLAPEALPRVRAPTLLIVGGHDREVIRLNEDARRQVGAYAKVDVVEDATHLFEEPGALEQVAELARYWFRRHLPSNVAARGPNGDAGG